MKSLGMLAYVWMGILVACACAEENATEMGTTEMDSMDDVTTTMEPMTMEMESCDCPVNDLLSTMTELIKVLTEDVQNIKEQLNEKCAFAQSNSTTSEDDSDESSEEDSDSEEEDEEEEEEEEEEEMVTTEPPPLECPYPFMKMDEACYTFHNYPSEWKSWGNANAYCQTVNATLASPSNVTSLRTYLTQYYSNTFWVGAKQSDDGKQFQWLTGAEVSDDDWASGYPRKPGAMHCLHLEPFSDYKAKNFYCGERFPFICQFR